MALPRSCWVAFILVLAATCASAQTGGISVTVTDGPGLPLPGVSVTISHELGYVKTSSVLTGADGTAYFPVLHPGPGYTIQLSFPGYAPLRMSELRVSMGQNLQVPVRMTEQLEERVQVAAERDLIRLSTTEASTTFGAGFLGDLPVPGRLYQNVLTMAPGVQDADGDGNPNVHGSRNRDFSAMVGGVRNVDPLTGQWMSRINPNSIEELEVITAGAGVELGRAQGGFARIVLKQGSNELEGVAEFYLRTDKLDGQPAGQDGNLPEQEFEWIQPAVQLSGPIVKDRLWFRLSHEYREVDTPIVSPGVFQLSTLTEWTHSDQITWQVSPRNKLALQFDADPQRIEGDGTSALRSPESTWTSERGGETYRLTWTAPYSPEVLVQSTISWQDLERRKSPSTHDALNRCVFGEAPIFLTQVGCTNLNTGEISGSYQRTEDDHSQRLALGSNATLYAGRLWGMSHQFKVGLSVENERYFRSLSQEPYGTMTQREIAAGFVKIIYSQLFTRLTVPRADDLRVSGTNWGLFFEDQFKPRPDLALTLGLRIDREELSSMGHLTFGPGKSVQEQREYFEALLAAGIQPAVAHRPAFVGFEQRELFEQELSRILCGEEALPANCQQILGQQIAAMFQKTSELYDVRAADDVTLSNTNFAPALALAWSPGSDGKTALKLAAGRHYNLIPLNVPLIELEPALTTIHYGNYVFADSGFNLGWFPERNMPIPDVQTVRRDLRTPFQDELTFAVERELWPETSISLRYISRKFEDQIQNIDLNKDVADFGRCKLQLQSQTAQNPHPWIAASPVDPANGFPGTVSSSFSVDPCPAGLCPEEVIDDWLTDPFSGLRYPDTRPGPGDGWDTALRTSLPGTAGYQGLDDCVGETVQAVPDQVFIIDPSVLRRPDGLTDLYVQTPFFGDIMEVGNYNSIDYRAVVLELVRRQFRSWEMNASYTWSEAKGDGEDFFQTLGDDPSLRGDALGYQSYDQRHVAKLNATTITPWGIRLGTAVTWQSGLPYSIVYERLIFDNLPPSLVDNGFSNYLGRIRQQYPTGQRNDQRNPSYWNVDVKATWEFRFPRNVDLQLSAEVFNVLDDETYAVFSSAESRGEQINGINNGEYRFGRRWQVGMKLTF